MSAVKAHRLTAISVPQTAPLMHEAAAAAAATITLSPSSLTNDLLINARWEGSGQDQLATRSMKSLHRF